MTAAEQGFLLLTGYLADPERKPLTVAQFRDLTIRMRAMDKPKQEREMTREDLLAIGCNRDFAQRILLLLSQEEQLQWYLEKGKRLGCVPVTRVSALYPQKLRNALGLDAPGVIWMKGDLSILECPAVALVGSRDLNEPNKQFAKEVGKQAAMQGVVLVSGDARGADKTAQDSCLEHGGKVISVVADELENHETQENVLFLSEDGFDLPFSSQRALQRNRVIHSLGQKTFVAQCAYGKGGTWNGTRKNLQHNWTPVFCMDDESDACRELTQMGAVAVRVDALSNFAELKTLTMDFLKP